MEIPELTPERPFEEDAPLAEAPPDATTAGPAAPPAEPAESAVQRLEDQLAELQERHLRLAAEFDNFRKRVGRERIELTDRAQAAFVIRLLDVLDDLDRLAAMEPDGPDDPVRQGGLLVDEGLHVPPIDEAHRDEQDAVCFAGLV